MIRVHISILLLCLICGCSTPIATGAKIEVSAKDQAEIVTLVRSQNYREKILSITKGSEDTVIVETGLMQTRGAWGGIGGRKIYVLQRAKTGWKILHRSMQIE
jgi:hypothetical protein